MGAQTWDLDEFEIVGDFHDDDVDTGEYAEPSVDEHWSADYDGTGPRR